MAPKRDLGCNGVSDGVTDPDSDYRGTWCAVLCMDRNVLSWMATVASFAAACDSVVITVAGPYIPEAVAAFSQHDNVRVVSLTLADTLSQQLGRHKAFVVVREPAIVSPDAFTRARKIIEDDVRVATVSFLSNDGDYLSTPHRNTPQLLVPSGMTEVTVTRSLRSEPLLEGAVPIPVPAGVVVAISATAVSSIGSVPGSAPTSEYAVLDLALRAVRRGLQNVLDPSTYVVRVPAPERQIEVLHDPVLRAAIHERYPYFPALYDHARGSQEEPLAGALALARSAIEGISVLVDGSVLGPFEMGTQVQILNLIQALSQHPAIRSVAVGIAGPIPAYAEPYIQSPKVKVVQARDGDFDVTERYDILHRPCQTDGDTPWNRWREIASRIVITVQDLIAYNNGAYFPNSDAWLHYRENFRTSMKCADGVVAISDDVSSLLRAERMPVSSENTRVIWNGTDHDLVTSSPMAPPDEILVHGMEASSFIFVLGTSYAHKNRDLAINAWRELRARGRQEKLILAGVVVPYGSTRNEEIRARLALAEEVRPDILILPDVRAEERLWLLSHASLVFYPTSAEGFGLVPFEAAQCGTPTLFVPFGPLGETLPDIPVAAEDWSPIAMAYAAEKLLGDPAVARSQIDAVKTAAKQFTWGLTADQAVAFYRDLLNRPAMGR